MTQSLRIPSEAELPTFAPPGFSDVVFVVDDDPNVRESVERYLSLEGFTVGAFPDGARALEALAEWRPRVIVTDYDMPGMTGLEFAERALDVDPELRLIVITGAGSESIAQASLRLGAADYLIKPIDLPDLGRAVHESLLRGAIDRYRRVADDWIGEEVRSRSRAMSDATLHVLSTVMAGIESRSQYFAGHSARVARNAARLARGLDLQVSDVEAIQAAGRLHDIGMSRVLDEVTLKDGPLDPGEQVFITDHCGAGAEMLEAVHHFGDVARYVLEHHERSDGSGYPDGKKGDEISLGGQIVGLAEVWTAMTEVRPYRGASTPEEAFAAIEASEGQFSRALLGVLRRADLH